MVDMGYGLFVFGLNWKIFIFSDILISFKVEIYMRVIVGRI